MRLLILILSIIFTSFSQVVFKWRIEQFKTDNAINSKSIIYYLSLLFDKYILLSVLLTIVGGGLWYYSLSVLRMSIAYPFTALSYLLVALFSYIILNEEINTTQVFGYVFVVIGIILITYKT